jgi:hypothetical protein
LKLKCDEPLSNFAFNVNLRRYNTESEDDADECSGEMTAAEDAAFDSALAAGGTEVDNFKKEKLLQADKLKPVLEFWRDATQYPVLRLIAKSVMAVPASSAGGEMLFSSASLLISGLRTMLSPHRVNKILTLYKNKHLWGKGTDVDLFATE